jgi:hypothetical protein
MIVTFQVIPVWQNKLQAIQYEDHLYTRTSHYSYEIVNNQLRLYPTPQMYHRKSSGLDFLLPQVMIFGKMIMIPDKTALII